MGIRLGEGAVNQLRTVVKAFGNQPRPQLPPDAGNARGFAWVAKAQTPAGGIAAGTSQGCTEGNWTGSAYTTTTNSFTVWNPSTTQAVSGNTWVTIAWVSGRWEVILEPC